MPENSRDNDKTETFVAIANGTVIAQYKIIEKIGSGGMGEVYLAEDTQLNREVALKFLPSHLCSDADCRARFKREAQAVAKLNHPNIVTIYEVGEYQNRPFIAMEYCRGETLRTLLKQFDVTTEKAIELTIGICEGLDKAHRGGVIHRDIKPANIVIDENGRARLLDFGLAAVRGEEQLTKTGSTMGTMGYMSPEQIRGEEADNRSDLFSLGVLLYEMVTGKAPFKAANEAATLNAILNDSPKPISEYKSDLPDGLQKIISRLFEKHPDNRYQSAAAVISDLKKLPDAQTVKPVSETPKDWWNRFVVTGAVAVLLFLAGYWLYNEYILKDTEESEPQRKMLAVLPFENLGDPEDEYFADGITDEITSRLARVNGLGVIARMSAVRYKRTDKTLKQIGKELGVDYILAGSIRWQKMPGDESCVRVSPQLIRMSNESHIWSDIYDETLTDVFAVQAKLANDVVKALNVTLVDAEKRAIKTRSTSNLEAYSYYLRGRTYWERWEHGKENLDRSIALLEKATALDSTFADAYAELAGIHCWYYETGYDQSEERKQLAEHNATLARKYDSLDAYSRIAWGYYYYYVLDDYGRALQELEQARMSLPNSSEAIAATAYVKRRLGQWQESFELQKQAHKLNPFNFWILYGLIDHCFYMRLWQEATVYVEMAKLMFPDHARPYCDEAKLYLRRDGDYVSAANALQSAPAITKLSMLIQGMAVTCAYFARDFDKAIHDLRLFADDLVSPMDTARYYYWAADLNRLAGHKEMGRFYLDSAKAAVERLNAYGNDLSAEILTSLGQIYADFGWTTRAIEAAVKHAEAIPITRDALIGMERMVQLAQTYTRVGELDKAVDLLDTLLSIPSDLTVATLRGDPYWDPLRDHPRFQAMLKKYEKIDGT